MRIRNGDNRINIICGRVYHGPQLEERHERRTNKRQKMKVVTGFIAMKIIDWLGGNELNNLK